MLLLPLVYLTLLLSAESVIGFAFPIGTHHCRRQPWLSHQQHHATTNDGEGDSGGGLNAKMRAEARLRKTARLTKQAKAKLFIKTQRLRRAAKEAEIASRKAKDAGIDQAEVAIMAKFQAEAKLKKATQKTAAAMERVQKEAEKAQRSLLAARLELEAEERDNSIRRAEAEALQVAKAQMLEKAQRSLLEARLDMEARKHASVSKIVWEDLLAAAKTSASDGLLPPKVDQEGTETTPEEKTIFDKEGEKQPTSVEGRQEKQPQDHEEAHRVILTFFDAEQRQWSLKNDFYTFLNQCSVQTFCFLLQNMHDPQTVLWMENFTSPAVSNDQQESVRPDVELPDESTVPKGTSLDCTLLNYHGLNAMDNDLFPSWDAYFEQLLESPVESYTVEADHFDYELDINPPRLCNRVLAVREQIAREFVNDLQVLSAMSNQTMLTYWDGLKDTSKLNEDGEAEPVEIDEMGGRDIKIESANLMFLSLPVDNIPASPLRKGNFDLLKLLTTQEAVHRVLNDPERQEGPSAVSNRFLAEFYASRIMHYFHGNVNYGMADMFLQDLLAESPLLQELDGMTALIDPILLAGLVLEQREKVATEWRSLATLVPDEHLPIRRLQLSQQVLGAASPGISFEEALRAGSSDIDTSATVQFTSQTNRVANHDPEPIVAAKEPVGAWKHPQINVTSVFE